MAIKAEEVWSEAGLAGIFEFGEAVDELLLRSSEDAANPEFRKPCLLIAEHRGDDPVLFVRCGGKTELNLAHVG